MTLTFFRSTNLLVNAIRSTFVYVLLQNLYQISISLIARMSLKLGKILTETRSWRPKWPIIGHYVYNMRNIYLKKWRFQGGVCSKKIYLDVSNDFYI